MLGLITVLVFSLGFAATLVVVGIVAAKVGEKVLDWLASIWMIRLQIATSLLIIGMGVVLTIRAVSELAALHLNLLSCGLRFKASACRPAACRQIR